MITGEVKAREEEERMKGLMGELYDKMKEVKAAREEEDVMM